MNTPFKLIQNHRRHLNMDTTVYNLESLNIEVEVTRAGNDVYGNPLYRVYPHQFVSFDILAKYPGFYRRYRNKGYAIMQSYNIDADITNMLLYLQVAVMDTNHVIVPAFKVDLTDYPEADPMNALSYEFSIIKPDGTYYTEEADDQEYDTFRVFPDGTVYGTLSNDYYVYDELELEGIDTRNVFQLIRDNFDKLNILSDQSQNAIENFNEEE